MRRDYPSREYVKSVQSEYSSLIHTLALGLLVANLEVLGALDGLQANGLAVGAGQSQRNLLGGLSL